jgi:hypothetical protein
MSFPDFQLTTREAMAQALPFVHKDGRDWWWLPNEDAVGAVNDVAQSVRACGNGTPPANTTVLRECPRKVIARVDPTDRDSLVFKACYLRTLRLKSQYVRHGLTYPKFGFDEGAALAIAGSRGVPVPAVRGYGHLDNRFGVPQASVLLLEYLPDVRPLENLFAEASEEGKQALVGATIPLLATLYRTGCHHIALKSDAIMVMADASRVNVLDLEHAKFFDQPNVESLAFQAAYFARNLTSKSATPVSPESMEAWFCKVMEAAEIADRDGMLERFRYYRTAELSRRERADPDRFRSAAT